MALPIVTPPAAVVSIMALPRAETLSGLAVEEARVETASIWPPEVAAVFSPKVKPVLPDAPKAQFQTILLVELLIVAVVVAAVI